MLILQGNFFLFVPIFDDGTLPFSGAMRRTFEFKGEFSGHLDKVIMMQLALCSSQW